MILAAAGVIKLTRFCRQSRYKYPTGFPPSLFDTQRNRSTDHSILGFSVPHRFFSSSLANPSSICYSFSVDCYFISSPWIFARVSICSSTISNISSSASSETFGSFFAGSPIFAESSFGLFGSRAAGLPLVYSFDAHDAYHLSAYIGSLPPRRRRYIRVTNAALLQLQLFGWIDDPVITIAPEIVD